MILRKMMESTISRLPPNWRGMAELVNGGYDFCDKTVMLDADIVLNETDGWENWGYKAPDGLKEWTPIGTYDSPFSGIFDGQGHTVKGGLYYEKELCWPIRLS